MSNTVSMTPEIKLNGTVYSHAPVTLYPPVVIVTTSLTTGTVGVAYSGTLAASGGETPYSWSATGLPAGLTLSSTGAITGTPLTAAAYSVTATVKDNAAHGGSARKTYTLTVSPGSSPTPPPVNAVYTGSYPPDDHASYQFPSDNAKMSVSGTGNPPYVDVNVWGPVSGEVIDVTVYTPQHWQIMANINNSGGGVTCFPNVAQYPNSITWNNLSYLISGWDETMPTDTSVVASACYDHWFDNSLVGPTGSAVTEVMHHFDFRNRGSGPWVAQAVPFGGYTVNGIAIPKTYWSLAASGGTCWWNLVDSSGNITSMPKGAIDVKAMNDWLVTEGYLSSTCTFLGPSLGWEICDTAGKNQAFVYNDAWWYGA